MTELNKEKIISNMDYDFKELELKLDVTPEAYARPRKSRKLEALGNLIFFIILNLVIKINLKK